MSRAVEMFDEDRWRNKARIVYDRDRDLVFIEVKGVHAGQEVMTALQVDRKRFAYFIRELGVL